MKLFLCSIILIFVNAAFWPIILIGTPLANWSIPFTIPGLLMLIFIRATGDHIALKLRSRDFDEQVDRIKKKMIDMTDNIKDPSLASRLADILKGIE